MCGIFGFLQSPNLSIPEKIIDQMGRLLHHRGPDDRGVWKENNITLGQTRLAIVDLSPAGHQPMHSASGRFSITFNGEIYNGEALKKLLLDNKISINFRGHSDTEIFLECLEYLGIKFTLTHSVGMFAFALWDRKEKILYLGRDRFGEKPLYYGHQKGMFAFASDLKALKPLEGIWDFSVNEDALKPYVQYGYIPGTVTIFKSIYKVKPGTYLEINEQFNCQENAYWSAREVAGEAHAHPLGVSFQEAQDQLEHQLKETISLQKMADVPVGAFLSGGVDSSLVVALMQAVSSQPVKTFTIGFHEKAFNEAPYAKQVAAHLKTDHTEVYLSKKEVLDIVGDMGKIYTEPFADSSQIPTYLVSRIARQKVTVCISGDGGDELFGGYHRYFQAQKMWALLKKVPAALRPTVALFLKNVPESAKFGGVPVGDKAHKLADVLGKVKTKEDLYTYMMSAERNADALILKGKSAPPLFTQEESLSYAEGMMLTDTLTYLTDDILVKVDRAAMANSLETRVPLLDHRVFELAWRLPLSYKMRAGQGKIILKSLLAKYIPDSLIDRPKMGFGVPYGEWLRTELRPWAEDLLDENTLRQQGFFNTQKVHTYWAEHVAATRQWQNILWNILMFQAWLREWRSS